MSEHLSPATPGAAGVSLTVVRGGPTRRGRAATKICPLTSDNGCPVMANLATNSDDQAIIDIRSNRHSPTHPKTRLRAPSVM